jgi:hypothetical protein
MTTDVDIVNAALIRLGERTITSLADPVKPAQLASAIYAELRDGLLRAHPWNFAIVGTPLAIPAEPRPDGSSAAAFLLPDGAGGAARCLRLLAVEDAGGRYLDHKVDGRTVRVASAHAGDNLLSASDDLTDAAWSVSDGSVAGAQAAAPFGYGLADELSDTGAGASAYVAQTITGVAGGALHAASVLVRPGGTPATHATLEMRFTGGSDEITGCYAEIDFSTGALAFRDPAGTVHAYERETLSGGWFRLSLAAANNRSGNDTLTLRIYADGLANGDAATQFDLLVAAPQLTTVAPLPVVCVAQVTDPDRMEPLFREALAARLAMELAEPLGKSTTLQQTMAGLYADKLREARSVDGQEGTHDAVAAETWLDARN